MKLYNLKMLVFGIIIGMNKKMKFNLYFFFNLTVYKFKIKSKNIINHLVYDEKNQVIDEKVYSLGEI